MTLSQHNKEIGQSYVGHALSIIVWKEWRPPPPPKGFLVYEIMWLTVLHSPVSNCQ
jgi:hypothetical protein